MIINNSSFAVVINYILSSLFKTTPAEGRERAEDTRNEYRNMGFDSYIALPSRGLVTRVRGLVIGNEVRVVGLGKWDISASAESNVFSFPSPSDCVKTIDIEIFIKINVS